MYNFKTINREYLENVLKNNYDDTPKKLRRLLYKTLYMSIENSSLNDGEFIKNVLQDIIMINLIEDNELENIINLIDEINKCKQKADDFSYYLNNTFKNIGLGNN